MTEPYRINSNTSSTSVQGANSTQPSSVPASTTTSGSSFSQALQEANNRVKFSTHAQQRLDVRSIEIDQTGMDRLSSAVDKAEAHGAKESLILMDDLAFIVNVRERTVVTTVDMNKRKEGVFTQIDTVVFADKDKKDLGSA